MTEKSVRVFTGRKISEEDVRTIAEAAAESLGIGSCYVGDIMENAEIQREILDLPAYVFFTVIVVFNYQMEGQMTRAVRVCQEEFL